MADLKIFVLECIEDDDILDRNEPCLINARDCLLDMIITDAEFALNHGEEDNPESVLCRAKAVRTINKLFERQPLIENEIDNLVDELEAMPDMSDIVIIAEMLVGDND